MKILVVEDDPSLADVVRRGLAESGHVVDVEHDGIAGERVALAGGYDAIVLDIMLPGLNGYRICATLREVGEWTPILMLTAKNGEYDEAEALDEGADDYLTKPFSYVVLVARLRALLRRSGRGQRVTYEAGELRLDPASHRVWQAEKEIELTAREFSVLEFLMSRAGEVVPKRDILEHVWDFDFEGDPNIIEVYIRRLRRKIDEPFDRHAIETIRGAGYRLRTDGG